MISQPFPKKKEFYADFVRLINALYARFCLCFQDNDNFLLNVFLDLVLLSKCLGIVFDNMSTAYIN